MRVGNGASTNRSDPLRMMKSGVTQIKALEATILEVISKSWTVPT